MSDPALPRPGLSGEPCRECGHALASDQRYCLACGTRRGTGAPVDFGSLIATQAPPRVLAMAPPAARRPLPLLVPAPVAATMLLALLLAGILIGSQDRARAQDALTASGGLTVRLPPAEPVAAVMPPPSLSAPPPVVTPLVPATPSPSVQDTPVQDTPVADAPVDTPAADPPADTTATDTPTDPSTDTTDTPTDTGAGDTPGAGGNDSQSLPPIKHVFLIVLADQGAKAFAPDSPAAYLAKTLVPDGTLLSNYHAIAHGALPNGVALLSGQGPNGQTQADCPVFTDVAPATITKGQEQGEGCAYSVQTATLTTQLTQQGLTARAYAQDMAKDPANATCRRPVSGAPDPWRDPRPGDAYATRRNPFVYFHGITDTPDCNDAVVDLDRLTADLAGDPEKLPAFSYIVPSLCDDGRATPCAPDAPAGLPAADAWLKEWVPRIQASKAFEDSLIVITSDQAPPEGPDADSSGCCGAPVPFPQLADNGGPATPGPGGGNVGALLLSPYVRKARVVAKPYNHFALLRTFEDLFGLDHLGYAAAKDLDAIGPRVLITAQKP